MWCWKFVSFLFHSRNLKLWFVVLFSFPQTNITVPSLSFPSWVMSNSFFFVVRFSLLIVLCHFIARKLLWNHHIWTWMMLQIQDAMSVSISSRPRNDFDVRSMGSVTLNVNTKQFHCFLSDKIFVKYFVYENYE